MTVVTITRVKDPLDGQQVRVLGRLRRHGVPELLVVLPDGSKRMIPRAWTDAEPDDAGQATATLGRLDDLLAACALVQALSERAGQEQAARQPPCEEDHHAARPAQSAAPGHPDASRGSPRSPTRGRNRAGDPTTGRIDRQSSRRPAPGGQ